VFEMRQARTLRVNQSIPLMVCRQTIAHCPAGYACMPERGATDGDQIQEALSHRDVGDVGTPDLIGPT
jgi:hypothetical protein